jgi:hypothetical protein
LALVPLQWLKTTSLLQDFHRIRSHRELLPPSHTRIGIDRRNLEVHPVFGRLHIWVRLEPLIQPDVQPAVAQLV